MLCWDAGEGCWVSCVSSKFGPGFTVDSLGTRITEGQLPRLFQYTAGQSRDSHHTTCESQPCVSSRLFQYTAGQSRDSHHTTCEAQPCVLTRAAITVQMSRRPKSAVAGSTPASAHGVNASRQVPAQGVCCKLGRAFMCLNPSPNPFDLAKTAKPDKDVHCACRVAQPI